MKFTYSILYKTLLGQTLMLCMHGPGLARLVLMQHIMIQEQVYYVSRMVVISCSLNTHGVELAVTTHFISLGQ